MLSKLSGLTLKTSEGEMSAEQLFANKKVLLVGLVGCFTGTCSNQVPDFSAHKADFTDKGVDTVAVMTVNDPAVVAEFQRAVDADSALLFIADWDAAMTNALGSAVDLSAAAFGVRSNRFAMLVDNGKVAMVQEEAVPAELKVSNAKHVLELL